MAGLFPFPRMPSTGSMLGGRQHTFITAWRTERLLSLGLLEWKERALVCVSLFFLKEWIAGPRPKCWYAQFFREYSTGSILLFLYASLAVIFIGITIWFTFFFFFTSIVEIIILNTATIRRHCHLWARTMHFFNAPHSPPFKYSAQLQSLYQFILSQKLNRS